MSKKRPYMPLTLRIFTYSQIQPATPVLSTPVFISLDTAEIPKKNPAYGRHRISRTMRIVAPHTGDTNSLDMCG